MKKAKRIKVNDIKSGRNRIRFDYDAVSSSSRRSKPIVTNRSEDTELTPGKRAALISHLRNLHRNYELIGWMIRRHLDYTTTFTFQSMTGNRQLDAALETAVERWSQAEEFDVSGRHPLHRFIRLSEVRRILDGQFGWLKLDEGKIQGIEGDRIASPTVPPKNGAKNLLEGFVHGIRCTEYGKPIAYCICKRPEHGNMLEFERIIPAERLWLHANYDRIDQWTGISPIVSAYNGLRDLYECKDLALAKMKVAQLFGLKITRQSASMLGDDPGQPSIAATDTSRAGYEIDFGSGPVLLDMDPGDDAAFLENKTPSQEFRDYTVFSIMMAIKALDLPYCFFDESHTNYSGSRQALIQYEKSAEARRRDNSELLDKWFRWRVAIAITRDEFQLPDGMDLADLRWEWIAAGTQWIDPLKEVSADALSAALLFESTPEIVKRRTGRDAWQVAQEEAAYRQYRKSLGLPDVNPGSVVIRNTDNENNQDEGISGIQ